MDLVARVFKFTALLVLGVCFAFPIGLIVLGLISSILILLMAAITIVAVIAMPVQIVMQSYKKVFK